MRTIWRGEKAGEGNDIMNERLKQALGIIIRKRLVGDGTRDGARD